MIREGWIKCELLLHAVILKKLEKLFNCGIEIYEYHCSRNMLFHRETQYLKWFIRKLSLALNQVCRFILQQSPLFSRKIFCIYTSEPRQGQQIVQRNRNNICLVCYKLFARQAANKLGTFKNTWLELFGQHSRRCESFL